MMERSTKIFFIAVFCLILVVLVSNSNALFPFRGGGSGSWNPGLSSDANLVAWYRFENNANDSEGSNHVSTGDMPTYSITLTNYEGDYYASFDGSADYMSTSGAVDLGIGTADDFSICARVSKPLDADYSASQARAIAGQYDWGQDERVFQIGLEADGAGTSIHATCWSGHTNGTDVSAHDHATDLSAESASEFFICMTYDDSDSNNEVDLYVRDRVGNTIGSDLTSQANGGAFTYESTEILVGAYLNSGTPGSFFIKAIDEVLIFKDILLPGEITDLAKGVY